MSQLAVDTQLDATNKVFGSSANHREDFRDDIKRFFYFLD